ncbi:c-type cytochrome [Roseisalinus antarcticus]|uniref:Cytochrome c n=1 Tax=Roseisalinus antarcticus TaxID=254357 RepID=A0A1Y5SSH5_9RHOB|nr:cytochrome c [Roseisalinus antarcticus]SLN47510.1 Cytochrome c [Roseisalinus antarcticus]
MKPLIALTGLALALGACTETGINTDIDGALAFQQDCAACHGADGTGEGSFGRQLVVTPPDLTRLAARNDGVFPRDYVMTVIDGFTRAEHFSAAMPSFGDGDMGPMVMTEGPEGQGTPVPLRLLELADYLESIQRD